MNNETEQGKKKANEKCKRTKVKKGKEERKI